MTNDRILKIVKKMKNLTAKEISRRLSQRGVEITPSKVVDIINSGRRRSRSK